MTGRGELCGGIYPVGLVAILSSQPSISQAYDPNAALFIESKKYIPLFLYLTPTYDLIKWYMYRLESFKGF
jgi:hypothetical protein